MCHTRQHTSSCICVPYLEEIIIRVKSKCNKKKKKNGSVSFKYTGTI